MLSSVMSSLRLITSSPEFVIVAIFIGLVVVPGRRAALRSKRPLRIFEMYADLNIPFVYTENEPLGKKKDRKGKGAGGAGASAINRDDAALQWSGIDASERKSLETRTRTLIHCEWGVLGMNAC